MKTTNPTIPSAPGDTEWPFEVRDVDEVLARIEQRAKRRQARRRRITTGTAAAAVVAFAVLWGVPLLRDTSSVSTACRQSVALADGSLADLNARTVLHTDFRYGRRLVRLDRGEAYFAVAKDPAHPFLVETPAGTVRVIGTKFNVRLTGDRAEVTLLEGAVTVERPDAGLQKLTPGEQLTTGAAVHRLDETALENAVAWREGRLALDGRTLGDAIERLAAYHGRQIEIAPEIAALRTGGSVSLEDLAAALAALQETLPIRVLPMEGGNFRIVRR